MRTLGIDLASSNERTAFCILEWNRKGATVIDLKRGADDHDLVSAHQHADVTGIDCPFGWPQPFRRLVAGHPITEKWSDDLRNSLRLRRTDYHVHEQTTRWPLSVSSERIAVPAMRCQLLLREMGVVDRSGDGRVYEVYPAASLSQWGFRSRGYKRQKGESVLGSLVETLRERLPWLHWDPQGHEELLTGCDDAFDALVASLTARAAKAGRTDRPPAADQKIAESEGWIALPKKNTLGKLLTA